VRIGRPVFPEYAGWRYGSRFARRRSRNLLLGAAGSALTVGAGFALAGPVGAILAGAGVGLTFAGDLGSLRPSLVGRRSLGEVQLLDGRVELLEGHRARRARLVRGPEGTWTLGLPEYLGRILKPCVQGEPTDREVREGYGHLNEKLVFDLVSPVKAGEVLRRIIPTINAAGGSEEAVAEAVQLHERWEGKITESVVSLLKFRDDPMPLEDEPLVSMALEMSVYEDQERRWLEGELYLLEAMWQEAERVAAIADELTLPEWITARIDVLRAGGQ